MGWNNRKILDKIRSNLVCLDDQPLGRAAIVIILFLDVFILTAIFNGLYEHTGQLSSPEEYIPTSCREMVIDRRWTPTSRMDNLTATVVSLGNHQYPMEERRLVVHPICAPLLDQVERITKERELTAVFLERNGLARERNDLQATVNRLKGAYDTSLLESLAKPGAGQTGTDAIRDEFQQRAEVLNDLQGRIAALEQVINRKHRVGDLWRKLEGIGEDDRRQLVDDLRRINFWHPVKRLGMQLLFLLPLLAVFFVWNDVSIRKGRGVQTLVSSHLLAVAFIPVLCKIAEALFDILPKKIIRKVIEFLVSLKLIAIWHYLVIASTVVVALVLIYVFQKKVFSRQKLIERRIAKGECQGCGKHLPDGAKACPFCGFVQFMPCAICGKDMHVLARHCRNCGSVSGVTDHGAAPK